MNALYFSVGGVILRICSDIPLGINEKWAAYRTAPSAPGFTYLISHGSPQPPQGQQTQFDYGKRLFVTSDAYYRVYCDVTSGKPFATSRIDRAAPNVCHIVANSEKLPWGTMVQHFFEQLSLQHALLQKKRLLLHGAYVLYQGSAIVFTAPSGTGKTTQAELWKRTRGARIINGDRLILGIAEDRVTAYGVPISGSSAECENVTAPVRAIVSLSQAKENRAAVCSKVDTVRILVNGTYLPPEHRPDMTAAIDCAISVAERLSCLSLACLPDKGAVETLSAYLMR